MQVGSRRQLPAQYFKYWFVPDHYAYPLSHRCLQQRQEYLSIFTMAHRYLGAIYIPQPHDTDHSLLPHLALALSGDVLARPYHARLDIVL